MAQVRFLSLRPKSNPNLALANVRFGLFVYNISLSQVYLSNGKEVNAMIMPLSVKNQSIESSGITKDYKEAICEYVWNGFEASASEVRISYTLGTLDGIDSVVISDNGSGIDYNDLTNTFGAFLTSQKNNLSGVLRHF